MAIDAAWWTIILCGVAYDDQRLVNVAIFAAWVMGAIALIGGILILAASEETLVDSIKQRRPVNELHRAYGWASMLAESGFLVYLGFNGVATFYIVAGLIAKTGLSRVYRIADGETQ